ncbi:MAG: MBL fold metallo-hydrolase [Clostridium sp.]|nr:MBL fold metallo-hydrolase [Clostridium sp.]
MPTTKLLFLGTGTSTGVPQIGCRCDTCSSVDPRDNRLRASAIVSVNGINILIDCGPDFRQQILKAGSPRLSALFVTHIHYDHVGGIDDLRPYCFNGPFPIYCTEDVAKGLRHNFPYCFEKDPYPGVPSFDLRIINPNESFMHEGIEVTPLPVMHYRLPIVGYKIGNLAYITDCKTMPDSTLKLISGIDTLVINALRHTEHISHLSLSQAIDIVRKINPRAAYFTHISHQLGRAADIQLPEGMHLANDMAEITVK